ncbi:MAG: hypothetical protein ACKVT0_03465 [Planctomycetaceae bacterium]
MDDIPDAAHEAILLRYPKHRLKPNEFIEFVELNEFHTDWQELDLDPVDELGILQACLMADPAAGHSIIGTGGLRYCHMRKEFDTPQKPPQNFFVYYAFYEEFKQILLVCASPCILECNNEERQRLQKLIEQELHQLLKKRSRSSEI